MFQLYHTMIKEKSKIQKPKKNPFKLNPSLETLA